MSKSILLVDDDSAIKGLYEKLLIDDGFTVSTASDGKVALEMIKKNQFDLILLDIMMPLIDGIGVLDELNTQKIPHPPVVFMTNLLNDPETKAAVAKGAVGILTKVNLEPDQFLATVRQILGLPAKTPAPSA